MGCPISIPNAKTQPELSSTSKRFCQNFGARKSVSAETAEEKNAGGGHHNAQPAAATSKHQGPSSSFIHKMLQPQLEPSVPPIGFTTKWYSVGSTLTMASDWAKRRHTATATDEGAATAAEVAAQLAETASLESCLARVISMRDEFVQKRQSIGGSGDAVGVGGIPLRQQQQQQLNVLMLQHHHNSPSPQPSITSALSSADGWSPPDGLHEKRQNICGTSVTFEWLFQRLAEKFKCPEEPEPQWIVEKMNDIGERDLDRTTVLRITFGWENAKLPKSVVLKICQRHDEDPPEEALLASALFKRECLTYEWLSKHHRAVAIPRIFVIKKQWSRSCNALLVMEDLSEKAQISELGATIPIEGVRDLLRVLAHLHAVSMVYSEDWHRHLDGAKLPSFLYEQIGRYATSALTNNNNRNIFSSSAKQESSETMLLGIERVQKILLDIFPRNGAQMSERKWPNTEENGLLLYVAKTVENYWQIFAAQLEQLTVNSCAHLGVPECLVHGQPIGRNVFFSKRWTRRRRTMTMMARCAENGQHDDADGMTDGAAEVTTCINSSNNDTVQALFDWTQTHCGCFGEDLAKALCWNMDGLKRKDAEQLLKMIQYYHYQLLKKLQSHGASSDLQKAITLETVQAAYERFVPVAAVTFWLFLPEELSQADAALLERAQQLVKEAAAMAKRLNN